MRPSPCASSIEHVGAVTMKSLTPRRGGGLASHRASLGGAVRPPSRRPKVARRCQGRCWPDPPGPARESRAGPRDQRPLSPGPRRRARNGGCPPILYGRRATSHRHRAGGATPRPLPALRLRGRMRPRPSAQRHGARDRPSRWPLGRALAAPASSLPERARRHRHQQRASRRQPALGPPSTHGVARQHTPRGRPGAIEIDPPVRRSWPVPHRSTPDSPGLGTPTPRQARPRRGRAR